MASPHGWSLSHQHWKRDDGIESNMDTSVCILNLNRLSGFEAVRTGHGFASESLSLPRSSSARGTFPTVNAPNAIRRPDVCARPIARCTNWAIRSTSQLRRNSWHGLGSPCYVNLLKLNVDPTRSAQGHWLRFIPVRSLKLKTVALRRFSTSHLHGEICGRLPGHRRD